MRAAVAGMAFFRPLRGERGMALLITLLAVSLLVAATVQYQKNAWYNLAVSNTFKENARLQTVAASGVSIALALLAGDTNESDSLLDQWATTDQQAWSGLFTDAKLQLRVIDLSGRLPVNSLVVQPGGGNQEERRQIAAAWQEVLLSLLQSGAFAIEDDNQARALVEALVDWLDGDDEEMAQGAESSYYQSLARPYRSRNGQIRSLDELLLVKGVTVELLYGGVKQRGLVEFLRAEAGDSGAINLNTADQLLLQSLHPEIDADLAAVLDSYRREADNEERLGEVNWYRSVSGWPPAVQLDEKLLVTRSHHFRISAEASFADISSRQHVEVTRKESGEIALLRKWVE